MYTRFVLFDQFDHVGGVFLYEGGYLDHSRYKTQSLDLAECQTECQTQAACIGIALTDHDFSGFDCWLLYDTTELTYTIEQGQANVYQITRCSEPVGE